MLRIIIPLLVTLGGLGVLFCSAKNYDWFMELRRAKQLSAAFGRNGTRVIYALLGIALVVVGIMVMINPPPIDMTPME